jgi:hypothetical protein
MVEGYIAGSKCLTESDSKHLSPFVHRRPINFILTLFNAIYRPINRPQKKNQTMNGPHRDQPLDLDQVKKPGKKLPQAEGWQQR